MCVLYFCLFSSTPIAMRKLLNEWTNWNLRGATVGTSDKVHTSPTIMFTEHVVTCWYTYGHLMAIKRITLIVNRWYTDEAYCRRKNIAASLAPGVEVDSNTSFTTVLTFEFSVHVKVGRITMKIWTPGQRCEWLLRYTLAVKVFWLNLCLCVTFFYAYMYACVIGCFGVFLFLCVCSFVVMSVFLCGLMPVCLYV